MEPSLCAYLSVPLWLFKVQELRENLFFANCEAAIVSPQRCAEFFHRGKERIENIEPALCAYLNVPLWLFMVQELRESLFFAN
jgi:hypothetical protein